MARVPVHDLDDAPEASRGPLGRQAKRLGQLINIFGEMAHSPALIGLYDTVEGFLGEHSALEPRVREAIHLTVANVNGCEYCQAAYTGSAKATGFSEQQTIQIRRGRVDDDDKLTALLQVTRQVAADKGHVGDGAWKDALEAGWDKRELLDAYAEVIRTILTNYFNHMVGTDLDLPAAPDLDA